MKYADLVERYGECSAMGLLEAIEVAARVRHDIERDDACEEARLARALAMMDGQATIH